MNATLTLADAASQQWDVAIVGAGPSGTLAARALAQKKHSVLLIDKSAFPRGKVCGGCINQRAQHALASAGLGDLLHDLGATGIDGLVLAANSRTASISIPAYYGITRETLDDALISAAVDAGAAFLPRTRARSSRLETDERIVKVEQEDIEADIRARIVIVADGLGGALANEAQDIAPHSRIGAGIILDDAPGEYRPNKVHMACGSGGYIGLARVEKGRVDIAAAFDPAFVRANGGLGPAAAVVFEEAGLPTWPALSESAWRGTPALTRTNTKVATSRMYVVGDAAGYVEPFTGEGIACAVTTGLAVVPIVSGAVYQSSEALEHAWQKKYRQIVTRRQYLCYALAHILRRPRAVTTAIWMLSRMPILARPLVSSVNETTPIQKSA